MIAEQSEAWSKGDTARYVVARVRYFLRVGMLHQGIALAAGVGAIFVLRAHLSSVRDYLGAAVPRLIANRVPAGSTVIRQVTATSVRFIDMPSTGGSVVLGVFPRGEGLAHLGEAQSVANTVMRDIYPAAPLCLIAWALLAITRTYLRHRLYPSADEYFRKHVDRTSRQLFAHSIDQVPERFGFAQIAPVDAGLTISEWAFRHGGKAGEDAVREIVALNRYRRQSGFGSVVTHSTKLKAGWSLVVPRIFQSVMPPPEAASGT